MHAQSRGQHHARRCRRGGHRRRDRLPGDAANRMCARCGSWCCGRWRCRRRRRSRLDDTASAAGHGLRGPGTGLCGAAAGLCSTGLRAPAAAAGLYGSAKSGRTGAPAAAGLLKFVAALAREEAVASDRRCRIPPSDCDSPKVAARVAAICPSQAAAWARRVARRRITNQAIRPAVREARLLEASPTARNSILTPRITWVSR